MDFTQYVLLTAVIAGVTELLSRARAKDWWTVATIATAATIGGVFGYFALEGLTVVTGIAAGFGASGALKLAGSVGKKSEPHPSSVLSK